MIRRVCPIVASLATLLAAVVSSAADIHLKTEATVTGQMLRLADIAEVQNGATGNGSAAESLGTIELFPVHTSERYITAQQVREALLARGVDLRQHTISGASLIAVVSDAAAPPATIFARRSPTADQEPLAHGRRRESGAAAAIGSFLKAQIADLPWQVELTSGDGSPPATDAEFTVLQTERRPERGAIRAWLGPQQFVMRWSVATRRREGIVAAEVSLPLTVVFAARDLARGAILQIGDLKLKPAGKPELAARGFEFPEDVLGKQVVRPLKAGQMIETEAVDSPDLVRRGERVSIIVNHRGVRVRTEGRAHDAGARGDVVSVESADRRNTFQAVVIGVNEVQVEVGRGQTQASRSQAPLGNETREALLRESARR